MWTSQGVHLTIVSLLLLMWSPGGVHMEYMEYTRSPDGVQVEYVEYTRCLEGVHIESTATCGGV
jgi:hypothetical protein